MTTPGFDFLEMFQEQNETNYEELPIDMRFNDGHVVSIVTYSVLMVISIIGNSTVLFLIIQRRRSNRSRINTMLMHLAVADLLVTVLLMPMEIGWNATVSWRAGDAMCRIMAFFRVFGIYLSSFVLVCISIDRYYAVLKPLQLMDVERRGKIMLIGAWVGSVVCSAPQMIVFQEQVHPNHTWYKQCITINTFPTRRHELTYSLFGMLMTYFLPLTVIIYTYSSILLEIYRKSRESIGDKMRRSSLGFLGRAKIRTLKMTIIIVFVFFVCWTPYYIMSVWYWFDRESARKVDQRIQKALFIFACTNSCMNPIVYGAFNIRRNTQNSTSQRADILGKKTSIENVVCRVSWRRPDNSTNEKNIKNQDNQDTDDCLRITNEFSSTINKNNESKNNNENKLPKFFNKFRLFRYVKMKLDEFYI